jgi:serine kinase of HPr protein (carbohydrate metabolism regulator)
MVLREVVEALKLEILNEGAHMAAPVEGGYVGDLLSDVIASGKRFDLWITVQAHENIIAVATLKDLAGVVLAKNTKPLEETMTSAAEEQVTLLRSPLTSYEIVAQLAALGIPGDR